MRRSLGKKAALPSSSVLSTGDGDETDSTHLQWPHETCGRLGFQWNNSIWLLPNQRMQRCDSGEGSAASEVAQYFQVVLNMSVAYLGGCLWGEIIGICV